MEQTSDRRYKRNKDIFEKGQARNTEQYERFTRKIKGWKKSLSKQAIKEWYLKKKNSSSFNWFEEEEI